MTREEIKEEILKNDQQQTNIIINAQFVALYSQLIRKGLFTEKDINEMQTLTNEYIEKVNEKITDEIFERIKESE